MLVLTRQHDEAVIIGDDIEVKIIDIRGDKVRLGIKAPKHVSVHREEVYRQIREENQKAAQLRPTDLASLPTQPPENKINVTPAADVHFPRLADAGDPFMLAAIEQAQLGLKEGGLPIGSVLVRGDHIIGRGRNRRVQHGDPMAHAEIDCLVNAGRQQTYRDTVLYSTLMPCYLCSGAAVQFGVPKIIVGESANFPGALDFLQSKKIEVVDHKDPQCNEMMSQFIQTHPELWNEDIGK
jgi:cytosine/creatinine deaminase